MRRPQKTRKPTTITPFTPHLPLASCLCFCPVPVKAPQAQKTHTDRLSPSMFPNCGFALHRPCPCRVHPAQSAVRSDPIPSHPIRCNVMQSNQGQPPNANANSNAKDKGTREGGAEREGHETERNTGAIVGEAESIEGAWTDTVAKVSTWRNVEVAVGSENTRGIPLVISFGWQPTSTRGG